MGKQIVKDATRQWDEKKVHPGLMDFFNLTLPCGEDECPIPLATAKDCYFGPDMQDVYMVMDMPKVNRKMQLVEADPFELMLQTWNQTCKIVYTGPKNAILAKESGCLVALNVKTSHMYDLVLSPSNDCLSGVKNASSNSYFSVDYCHAKGDRDPEDFVQVKPHHGLLHVYCSGCQITIDNITQTCPKEVFVLPMSARFKINNQDFVGSIVNVEHQESPDPLFTLKTNAILKPGVDYQELMRDPMVNNKFIISKGEQPAWLHEESHIMIILFSFLFFIILILVLVILKCYFDNKRIKVRVVRKPKGSKVEGLREAPDTEDP